MTESVIPYHRSSISLRIYTFLRRTSGETTALRDVHPVPRPCKAQGRAMRKQSAESPIPTRGTPDPDIGEDGSYLSRRPPYGGHNQCNTPTSSPLPSSAPITSRSCPATRHGLASCSVTDAPYRITSRASSASASWTAPGPSRTSRTSPSTSTPAPKSPASPSSPTTRPANAPSSQPSRPNTTPLRSRPP